LRLVVAGAHLHDTDAHTGSPLGGAAASSTSRAARASGASRNAARPAGYFGFSDRIAPVFGSAWNLTILPLWTAYPSQWPSSASRPETWLYPMPVSFCVTCSWLIQS